MTSEFIPYEQALEMKELGFNEECFGYMSSDNEIATTLEGSYNSNMNKPSMRGSYCTAILWQQAFRWFREEHDITYSIIWKMPLDGNGYLTEIQNGREVYKLGLYKSYQEAQLACLKKLIEIVKQKK
jgi:hypothetical protein